MPLTQIVHFDKSDHYLTQPIFLGGQKKRESWNTVCWQKHSLAGMKVVNMSTILLVYFIYWQSIPRRDFKLEDKCVETEMGQGDMTEEKEWER